MIDKTSHLEIVSAAWIIASNDPIALIHYDKLKERLSLENDDFNLKNLIARHGELFKFEGLEKDVNAWKEAMKGGEKLPPYIKRLDKGPERNKAIDEIQESDFFRSRFRNTYDAPRSDITIINWGLEHVNRIRTLLVEEKKNKFWLISNFLIPVLTALVSVCALIISYLQQKNTLESQKQWKTEFDYKAKQDGYTTFMKSVASSCENAKQKNKQELTKSLETVESSYYSFERLLKPTDKEAIWRDFQSFSNFCYSNLNSKLSDTVYNDSCLKYKIAFRTKLQDVLNKDK